MSYNQNDNSRYENRVTVNNGCGGNGSGGGGTTGGATEAKQDIQIQKANDLKSLVDNLLDNQTNGNQLVNTGLLQPLTNTELRATPVAVLSSLPTGAATSANQDITNAKLDTANTKLDLVAKDGTDITTAVLPAGGSGIRGYLSAIWEWVKARMPALGQANMAASTPVVIASDQSPLPNFANPQSTFARPSQSLSTVTVSNGATNAIASTDSRISSIQYVTFQITGTFVISFLVETSEDGVNFVTNNVVFNTGTGTRLTGNITAAGCYAFQVMGRFFRVRTVSFTSGAAVVTSQISYTPLDGLIALGGNTTASISNTPTVTTGVGSVTMLTAAATSGIAMTATELKANSGTPTAVFKGSAGTLLSVNIISGSTVTVYVKLYDKATAPISTDIPILRFAVPAAVGERTITFPIPVRFTAGLSAIATNGATDSDTTAITGQLAAKVQLV